VAAGEAGAYASIQAAVDALPAVGPCTIAVGAGVYHEAIEIAGKNAGASAEAQRIDIRADGAVTLHPEGEHAVRISGSRLITVRGFTVTGARGSGVRIDAEGEGNRDVLLAANDIHNNGTGVEIGGTAARTALVNNLIRHNRRNGLAIGRGQAGLATYVVNNTFVGNGWNGVHVARGAEVHLVNNLVAGNGTATGTAAGRWGLLVESVAGAGTPALVTLSHNVFYSNGLRKSPAGGDIGNVRQALDPTDEANYTTAGGEAPGLAGCTTTACNGTLPVTALFVAPGVGPSFELAPGSPALGRGRASFVHDGREWVPETDFAGEPRGGDAVDVGYDEFRRAG
jgi:hypothetical protein